MKEEIKQKIIKAVTEKKISLKDLAEKLYISERQLKFLLLCWGIELPQNRKYKRVPLPERNSLMQVYQRCKNTQKTAEYFGVGMGTVNRWMRKLNIPTRKLGGMTEKQKAKYLEKHIEKLEDLSF